MNLRSTLLFSALVFGLLGSSPAFAQNPAATKSNERRLGRIIGMTAGAVGGFFIGYAVSDDDAINATQKMTRNVAIGAVAGAVGGYFAGRAVDKQFLRVQARLLDQKSGSGESSRIARFGTRFEKAHSGDAEDTEIWLL